MINELLSPKNYDANTDLYLINRPSLRISITMNNNSIVTLIYKVCASTYIIEIWRSPNPIMQLYIFFEPYIITQLLEK